MYKTYSLAGEDGGNLLVAFPACTSLGYIKDLRKNEKLITTIKKIKDKKSSLLAEIFGDVPTLRLKSRKLP